MRRAASVKRVYSSSKKRTVGRRRKRNPSAGKFDFQTLLVNGAFGIGGAIANTFLSNMIGKLVFKGAGTPVQMNMTRLVSAIALSYGAYKSGIVKKDNAEALAIGMLTAVGLPVVQQAFGLSGNYPSFMGSSVDSIMDNMGLSGLLEDNTLSGLLEPSFDGYEDLAEFM
jgi:hypothetical protein